MFQKKLISSAIAVAALGLSSIALANGGGYGAAPVAAAPAPAPMVANDQSFYLGIGAGYADTHWDNMVNGTTVSGLSVKDNGFAGRVFGGYNFNRFLAIEAGWTYLPKAKYQVAGVTTNTLKNYAVDLDGKVTAPLVEGFGVYGKLGVGYLHTKGTLSTTFGNTNSISHVGPVVGAGVSYHVTPNLVGDLGWTRYSGDGKIDASTSTYKYQPNPDVVLLSVAYEFPANM